jgi:hypothetical protein
MVACSRSFPQSHHRHSRRIGHGVYISRGSATSKNLHALDEAWPSYESQILSTWRKPLDAPNSTIVSFGGRQFPPIIDMGAAPSFSWFAAIQGIERI